MKKNLFYSLILILFVFIFVILYKGLDKPNSYIPIELKSKNLEEFKSIELLTNEQLSSHDIIKDSEFTLINIWASWCVPCRTEHPVLINLSKNKNLNIIGLNYKDKKNNAISFLNEFGNPFSKILVDSDGTISISLGAYGVPETFLLNKFKIVKKYIGPLTDENILEIIRTTEK